ncbi:MAG: DUF4328 domain-containing protein [Acidimicrobiia bacterium]
MSSIPPPPEDTASAADGGSARPEGWYPDPWGLEKQRWYDGATWTRHLWPPDAPELPTQEAQPTPGIVTPSGQIIPVTVVEAATKRTARALSVLIPLAGVGLGFELLGLSHSAPELRASVDIMARGGDAKLPALPTWLSVASQVGEMVIFATIALFAVWLYRATIWARIEGIQGRLSPGWSLGVWIIPLANVLLGYVATVDTAPTTQTKGIVRKWWACFVTACIAPFVIIMTGDMNAATRTSIAAVAIATSLVSAILGRLMVLRVTSDLETLTHPKN